MLAISRFAHYLKAMMRDKIGSFTIAHGMRALAEQNGSRIT